MSREQLDKELKVLVKNIIDSRRTLRERFGKDLPVSPGDIVVTSTDEKFLQCAIEIVEQHIVFANNSVYYLQKM